MRFKEDSKGSSKIQGGLKGGSTTFQGGFNADSRNMREGVKGGFNRDSRNIQEEVKENSRNIKGEYKADSTRFQ